MHWHTNFIDGPAGGHRIRDERSLCWEASWQAEGVRCMTDFAHSKWWWDSLVFRTKACCEAHLVTLGLKGSDKGAAEKVLRGGEKRT